MKKMTVLAGMALTMAACGNNEKEYDATGTFEATETVVYAEQSGRLLLLGVDEGSAVTAWQEVGLIDTTAIVLKIRQLEATKVAYDSQKPDLQKQIAATQQQLDKALTEQRRYTELVNDGAAPQKMLDDMTSQVLVLQKQLSAQTSALNTQLNTLDAQKDVADTQIAQLRDQLQKCHVCAPTAGTVLEKYVEEGEFVTTGKPLFRQADTQNMFLRAYVTSAQLKDIALGQAVTVMSDYGGGQRHTYQGTVSWISSRSEFTPKTIVTDDERADLVYAVKVSFQNDGYAKIGMYGEVKF